MRYLVLQIQEDVMESPFQNELSKLTMALLQAQGEWWSASCSKLSDSTRRLAELNMNTMKESMDQTAAAAQELSSANSPQQWAAIINAQVQPRVDRVMAYSKALGDITSTFQTDIGKLAQKQYEDTSDTFSDIVDGLVSSVPDDAKPTVAMVKSVMDSAKAGYEQMNKTTQKMVEVLDASRAAAIRNFPEARKPGGGKGKPH
jgi:phasin family protein